MHGCDKLYKEHEQVVVEGSDGQSWREFEVCKTDETMVDNGKKAELEIAFSIFDVQKQYFSMYRNSTRNLHSLQIGELSNHLCFWRGMKVFAIHEKLLHLILMVVLQTSIIGVDTWSLMFQSIPEKLNSLYKDTNWSFYVGVAGGRKNDHSDADIKFAKVVFALTQLLMFNETAFSVSTLPSFGNDN
ncbi:hypothetical protein C5167_004658 [Papaver somniferum]|uniref:Uncharacterized protein n=1 Tax=Papaver somniferum TaxID=3469 RepID=A0A4Y7JC34_PAPSO|nr:hypothetical protein C5167_004658 [Papaver somniferum]